MWVLVVTVLIAGEWVYEHHGPFGTQQECEQANVRMLMNMTFSGLKANGDCQMRL